MKPIERILAAADFSDASQEALKAALFLTQLVKGRLQAVHVVSQTPFGGHFFGPVLIQLANQLEKKALDELTLRLASLSQAGQEISAEVRVGVPFVELIRAAKEKKVQFLVAGAKGENVGLTAILGSTAENLIRKSECPVWIVRGSFQPPRKILLLTDLSEEARAGFRLGLFLAKLFGASAHLLHVFESPFIPSYAAIDATEFELKMKEMVREEFRKWVEEASVSKVELAHELKEGSLREAIDEVAKREACDLAVISTHGGSGLFHKHLGSVAAHLARQGPCSVITVRPEGFKFKEI